MNKNMSCKYCKSYMGLNDLCENGHMVTKGNESLECYDYQYNGELNGEKE